MPVVYNLFYRSFKTSVKNPLRGFNARSRFAGQGDSPRYAGLNSNGFGTSCLNEPASRVHL